MDTSPGGVWGVLKNSPPSLGGVQKALLPLPDIPEVFPPVIEYREEMSLLVGGITPQIVAFAPCRKGVSIPYKCCSCCGNGGDYGIVSPQV